MIRKLLAMFQLSAICVCGCFALCSVGGNGALGSVVYCMCRGIFGGGLLTFFCQCLLGEGMAYSSTHFVMLWRGLLYEKCHGNNIAISVFID